MLFKIIGIVFVSFIISSMIVVGASMINYDRFGFLIITILSVILSFVLFAIKSKEF